MEYIPHARSAGLILSGAMATDSIFRQRRQTFHWDAANIQATTLIIQVNDVFAQQEATTLLAESGNFGYRSRNARFIWSVNGFTRYDAAVLSFVEMNTSAGIPGTSLISLIFDMASFVS
jgi:hypothetical protein